ncbi:MAG: peptidoglycan-binding protein, partial [Planctomycetota bacterium]
MRRRPVLPSTPAPAQRPRQGLERPPAEARTLPGDARRCPVTTLRPSLRLAPPLALALAAGALPAVAAPPRGAAGVLRGEAPAPARGDRGPAVLRLQRLLNALGAGLVEDGIFGPRTAAALEDFQRRAGLPPG